MKTGGRGKVRRKDGRRKGRNERRVMKEGNG